MMMPPTWYTRMKTRLSRSVFALLRVGRHARRKAICFRENIPRVFDKSSCKNVPEHVRNFET